MPHYEYDKDYPFAAFITNLGKYNEGSLVGEWVKFPTTAEELQKVFERIGIGSKDDFGQPYEEWFITDYDCPDAAIGKVLGEYESLSELNYLAGQIMELRESDDFWRAVLDLGENTGSVQELINLTESAHRLTAHSRYPRTRRLLHTEYPVRSPHSRYSLPVRRGCLCRSIRFPRSNNSRGRSHSARRAGNQSSPSFRSG